MVRVPGCEAVYDVANQWRDRCLADDKSLLWPEEVTWKIESLEQASKLFEQVESNKLEEYWTGLALLLTDQPTSVRRIAADLAVIYNVAPSWLKPARKRVALQPLLDGIGNVASPMISIVDDAFGQGMLGVAIPYLNKGVNLAYLADFAIRVKKLAGGVNDQDSVQASADAALSSHWGGVIQARNVVLHLLLPESYEAIAAQNEKKQIVSRMGHDQPLPSDTDAALRAIRTRYEEELGRPGFNFYDEDIKPLWQSLKAEPARGNPRSTRRYWKIAPGEQGNRWDEFRQRQTVSVGWAGSPDLRTLDVASEDELKERLQQTPEMQEHNYKFSHAAYQLWSFWQKMGVGDLVCAYSAGTVFGWGEITGEYEYEEDERGYPHRRSIQWRVTEPVQARSLSPRLQQKLGQRTTILELSEEDFDEIRSDDVSTVSPVLLDNLAAATYLDPDDLNEIHSLLLEKKQLIFEGPPGSGKTYLADLFARYFTGNPLEGEHDERIEVVQFHQSYGYEDFVQGIRPVTDGEGRLQYRVMPGIFLRHCDRARANPDKRFVLIIDEINRGNLSRIFGELLMLLEYRDKRIRLPYSAGDDATEQTHLQIPPNLYLIGTMNSTDRSLSMIDYALRRRFFFYRLLPVVDGKATVLDRWLTAKEGISAADRARVLAYFVRINTEIGTRLSADFQIGHSYFMVADIATSDGLNRVWRRALKPLLEEYFHTVRGLDEVIAALAPDLKQLSPDVVNAFDSDDDPGEMGGLGAPEG